MKQIYILATLFLGCFFYGQSLQINDADSGNPLEGVKITNQHGATIGITNNKGVYNLENKTHSGSIRLSILDYEDVTIDIESLNKEEENQFFLNKTTFELDGLVVEGGKKFRQNEKTPHHTVSLSEKDVHFYQAPNMADLLKATGEVYVQKSQLGGGSPMIRGFATNRVLIVVDDIRMNNAIFRSGNIQNVLAVDQFGIKNINVVAGPSSVLYGSDAIGGVMNFVTEENYPTQNFEFSGKFNARYASASEEKTANAQIKLSGKKWSSFTSFSAYDYGDLEMGSHGPNDYLRHEYVKSINGKDFIVKNNNPKKQLFTGYKQKNLMQNIKFMPNNKLEFNYKLLYAETSEVPRYDRLIRYRKNKPRHAEWYYGPQKWTLNALSLKSTSKNLFFNQMKSTVSHQLFKESRHSRGFEKSSRANKFEEVDVFSWDNNFLKEFNSKQSLSYGTDIMLNYVKSTANKEDITTGEKKKVASRYPEKATWNQFGVYANFQQILNPTITIEAGTRFSLVNSTSVFSKEFYDLPFDNADFQTSNLSGSLATLIEPNNNSTFRMSLSTGFRAPNIDDIGKIFDSEPGNVIVPNPGLKPENIVSLEGGYSQQFGRFLFVNLNIYHSWLKNALVRRDFMLNGKSTMLYQGEESQIQAIQNASKANVYGGVFSTEINLDRRLKFFAKVNYTKGEEELDNGKMSPLRHAAPLFGNIGLRYQNKFAQILLETEYNGEIKAEEMPLSERKKTYMYALNSNGEPFVPSWFTLNLRTQFKLSKETSVNVGLENILDKRYQPYSSGVTAPGRNFIISVQTAF